MTGHDWIRIPGQARTDVCVRCGVERFRVYEPVPDGDPRPLYCRPGPHRDGVGTWVHEEPACEVAGG